MSLYKILIGIEIHMQLSYSKKLFSQCLISSKHVNTKVTYLDAGFPGIMPYIETLYINFIIFMSIIFHCTIVYNICFDRKNYIYHDLPLGYQISQTFNPILRGGYFITNHKCIKIKKIHLENDAGKTIFDSKNSLTLMNFNRSGSSLAELVTYPDFNSFYEIKSFLQSVKILLSYSNICYIAFELGSFRCDINISVNAGHTNHKVEIKNLSSFYSIHRSVKYEIMRQTILLRKQCSILQETRSYNINKNITETLRRKENYNEYGYFFDFDIPVFQLQNHIFVKIANSNLYFLIKKRIFLLNTLKISYLIKTDSILQFIIKKQIRCKNYNNMYYILNNYYNISNFIIFSTLYDINIIPVQVNIKSVNILNILDVNFYILFNYYNKNFIYRSFYFFYLHVIIKKYSLDVNKIKLLIRIIYNCTNNVYLYHSYNKIQQYILRVI